MPEEVHLSIFFTDGTRLVLKVPRQASDLATEASRIRKALERDTLAIETEGDLIVIPLQSIKYARLHPAPEGLPQEVVRGAVIAD